MTEKWGSLLLNNEDVAFEIVADILKDINAENNPGRTGRRPRPEAMSLEEVLAALFPPRYTTDRFRVALNSLMIEKDISQKELAKLIGVNPSTVCRFLSGTRYPTMETIESISGVLGVPPHWFTEYREHAIAQALSNLLAADPERTRDYFKKLLK